MENFINPTDLLDHSVPTILVIVGAIFIIYPFLSAFEKINPSWQQSIGAFILGILLLISGATLALFIVPESSVPAIIYPLPLPTETPVNPPANNEQDELFANPESTQIVEEPTIQSETNADGSLQGDTSQESVQVMEATLEPTSTAQPLSTSTSLPSPTPHLTDTPTPTAITDIAYEIPIRAVDEGGVRVDIPLSGMYEVFYLGDAYSPWPNEQSEGYQGWTTIAHVYINKNVQWGRTEYGLVGPINHDSFIGPGGYYLQKDQAISVSNNAGFRKQLNAGDFLTFVTLDEQEQYGDNRGKVDIGIRYLGEQ